MVVTVGLCGPGMLCLAPCCSKPARLWIKRGESVRMPYCPVDLVDRMRMHQRRNRAIEISDDAKALLDEVPL